MRSVGFLLLLSVACDPKGQAPTPSATVSPPSTPTVSAAPAPTPTPAPSPTPVPTLASAAPSSSDAPEEPPPKVLKVSRDEEELGTIDFRKNPRGTLTLASQSRDAKELETLWKKISSKDTVSIKMHRPSPDPKEMGPLAGYEYRRGTPGYPNGVSLKLLSEGYSVE